MKKFTSLSAVLGGCLFLCTLTGFQCSSPNITSGKMYYQQYESSRDEKKLDLAMEAFQKEVAEKPASAEAWYWVGFIQGVKKNYMDLYLAWEKSRSCGPEKLKEIDENSLYFWGQAFNTGASLFKKAQARKDKAGFAAAEQCFKAATLLAPDSSAKYGAYVNWAFTLVAQDRIEEAIAPLQMQNERVPNPDAYRLLGQIMLDQANNLNNAGKKDEAGRKYESVLKLANEGLLKFPEDTELNQLLLNVYVATNRLAEAKPKFMEFAEKNPQDRLAQYAYGTVLLETKEYQNAIVYFQRALALDPTMDNALYNTCVAYLRWGIAERDAETAKNPEKSSTKLTEIARKSLPHLEALLKLKPDNAQNWDLAGKIYTALGMTKEAEKAYGTMDELKKK